MPEKLKLLKLTQDFTFKVFFSRNEQALKALLNVFLPLPDPIVDINILNPEPADEDNADSNMVVSADSTIMAQNVGQKEIILDLKITLGSGEKINVEMQTASHAYFRARVLFYWCGLHHQSVKKGDNYGAKPTYSLIFTTFSLWDKQLTTDSSNAFSVLSIKPPHFEFSDNLRIVTVELNKGPKEPQKLLDLREKWCYFLYHSTTLSEEARKILSQHEELKMALNNLDQLKEDEQLRQKVSDREMSLIAWHWDRLGLMENIEKGKAEGRAEGQLAIAKHLLKKGYTLPEILEITGLSATDLSQLK